MIKFENYRLGDNDEDILVETSEENALASLLMARQANRTIDIISRLLDPAIYDTPEFVEAVKQMILKSSRTRVRILVSEPDSIVKRGHRLLDLAQSLTTFIEIRVPGMEHESLNDALFVADETGYIYRQLSDRFEGKLNFNDQRASRLLIHEFDEIWEKSRSDPNFRRTLL